MKIFYSLIILIFSQFLCVGQTFIQDYGGGLSERWLIEDDSTKLFKIVPYKPVYILLANYTTDINDQPTSENPNNSVDEPFDFSKTELKFQLSFKTRALKNILGRKIGGDIWIAYTQSSRWQVYSGNISRPFRETNYEPEVMLVIPTPYKFLGLNGVFAGVGITHQSNGRADPLSRSWDRIVAQVGWERPSWNIVYRHWWRFSEDFEVDNNPNVQDFVGRMELLTAFENGRHDLSLLARHSLRGGDRNRGNIQLDYAVQIVDLLKLHAQIFHGYGESLLDYNHKQTTFGIGISLLQWR